MIKVTNLTKKYGERYAINNISFEVNDGEVVGFLGPRLTDTTYSRILQKQRNR